MNTKNNSQSMATVVETYLIEETIDLIHDNEALAKWHEKVEELQLEGQKTIVKEDKSPIPFLWMNSALVKTFETLVPSKSDIADYNKTAIPVELLSMVSMCVKEKYFDKIQVWFNEKEKDPAIIGYKFTKPSTESDWWLMATADKYLIGRWADVKASLDQLIARAKALFISQQTASLKAQIKRAQRELEDIEQTAETDFGNSMPTTDNLPF